jgi:Ca-activated chloride channel homolog
MSVAHPWFLLLALAPALWAAWEWRSAGRRSALLLKAAALLALLAALAGPSITVYSSKLAVAILADTSASVSADDLAAESDFAARADRSRGRHWLRVIPFARTVRDAAPEELQAGTLHLRHTAGSAGRATDLEAALRDGVASLPAGMVPRLVLVSDGLENLGSAARAIWQARQLGIPVDTVPLAGLPQPGLLLESASVPGQVYSGERFPILVTLVAPRATSASVEMTAEGRPIGSSQVDLAAGVNHLRLHASVNSVGAIALAGRIAAPGLGETRFENAVTLARPRALVVSNDPPASEAHLRRVLEANQFAIDRAPDGVPQRLDGYQLVVINNWDAQSVPAARQAALEDFVKKGGGLAWIAGERNVYVSRKGREDDPLERLLPARLAPPRSPEGTAVVLIIDKSSSMEGRKIELARLAAIGVVENLRPIDSVGVLIFDNSFQWAVPIRKATDRAAIARLISGIAPDGGTQIAPALAEAYARIQTQNAVSKHIVLLTDGISEEGDSVELAHQALSNRVTISTVGLGQDVNRAFLEKVAATADGKSYFLNDPAGLEQLLLRDVEEHTGATAVEKPVAAKVVKQADILAGVGMDQAPPLGGYIRFEARPASDTILQAGGPDPLLVRWQYGLGRAIVFASDAKNRWAAGWIQWPGFDRLWANIFRDLLPHAPASEATADFDRASNLLVVDYRLSKNVEAPPTIPDIFVLGPNGFQAPLLVGKVAAGLYRGRLPIGQREGLFRVRPLQESAAFPEIGFYRQEDELKEHGNNEPLLRQIASATGGHFNPAPGEIFDAGSRSIQSTMELWPGLLGLALILNLAELVLRKWKGVRAALRLRPIAA